MEETMKNGGERDWLSFEEAQELLPEGTTKRWISARAKELGCYGRFGKTGVILKDGWPHFLKGEVWRESAAKKSTSGGGAKRVPSTPRLPSPTKKADASPIFELNAVRERLTSGKRKNSPKQ